MIQMGWLRLRAALAVLATLALSGCATVRPYEREHLVDRIMSFQADAKADARLTKSFDAREGSTGGNGGAGGGCACSN
jgi:hypothetical protein